MRWWSRLRGVVVNRILGLNDTPHRIAWGVFLGFVVAFSPTVGFQMMLFVAVAAVFRANKVSGLPVVWITNPVTVVPVYWACWRVGAFVLGTDEDPERGRQIIERLMGADTGWTWGRLVEAAFWAELGATLWELGAELWLGGLLVGVVTGALAYPATLWGVRAYRRARGG
ncbi:MAG TPA: DUF2062 domain-containing protein [Sandaracinaceae bacterium LLY-WYZ-13_1]|nr:DUF2062 domain-containing protein [Sandaracinaceae bacterium LLY-WYZ-13_1]